MIEGREFVETHPHYELSIEPRQAKNNGNEVRLIELGFFGR
jgi:hypothetical protein